MHGDRSNARKSRSWLSLAPSDKQREMLGLDVFAPVSRYRASCLITWRFSEKQIQKTIQTHCYNKIAA